ncbi:MAG: DNA alkylation repair protein [Faecousia sp.]
MNQEIKDFLRENAEAKYAAFHKKLCPDTAYEIIGVRMPKLRKFAKALANRPSLVFENMPQSYEEVMLLGLTAAYRKSSFEDKLPEIWAVLPLLDCWAFTDCMAATFCFGEEELGQVWDFCLECLARHHPYTRRFGLVMMLDHLIRPEYIHPIVSAVSWVTDENYYVRMAQAWLLAELGTYDFSLIEDLLKSGTLEIFTHNKTISKLRDSYRITPEQKNSLIHLRRKEETV